MFYVFAVANLFIFIGDYAKTTFDRIWRKDNQDHMTLGLQLGQSYG